MEQGFIKVFRRLLDDDEWLLEKFTRAQAWIDLIGLAYYKDSSFLMRGIKVEVKRGQVACGERALGKRWKWSKGKVRKFLQDHQKDHRIVQQKNIVMSLYTIVNYDMYQSNCTTEKTTEKTTKRPQKDHIERKDKKEKNINISFDRFWNCYGKKIGKPKCEKKWNDLTDSEREKIIQVLPAYIESTPELRYRKHPLTWLNGKHWDDEIDIDTSNQQSIGVWN